MKSIFENDFIKIKKCKHGYFAFNKNDLFIGKSLDFYGQWCEGELDILGQLLSPGDVVIDVGANIGTHTVFFSKVVGERGKVFAIEPQRLVFQLLNTNIALNCLLNVLTLQILIGSLSGNRKLGVFDPRIEANFGRIIVDPDIGDNAKQMTLDELFLQPNSYKPSLIKIDVEGMEWAVLQGAIELINETQPILFIENNKKGNSNELIQLVSDVNYHAFWHIEPYYKPDNFFNNQEDVFNNIRPEANMLCVHKSIEVNGLEPVIMSGDNWEDGRDRCIHNALMNN